MRERALWGEGETTVEAQFLASCLCGPPPPLSPRACLNNLTLPLRLPYRSPGVCFPFALRACTVLALRCTSVEPWRPPSSREV
jgi:hypothetical protein